MSEIPSSYVVSASSWLSCMTSASFCVFCVGIASSRDVPARGGHLLWYVLRHKGTKQVPQALLVDRMGWNSIEILFSEDSLSSLLSSCPS